VNEGNPNEILSMSRDLSDPALFKKAYFDNYSTQKMWRVKMLLSPIKINTVIRKIGRFVVPHMEDFPYGMLHTALQIGPQILDWAEESLVIPANSSDFTEFNAILVFDIDAINFEAHDGLINKACEAICHWNVHCTYHGINCNSQTFVQEILKAMGLTFQREGAINEYINKLLHSERPEMVGFVFGDKKFKTHEELDEFVIRKELNKKDPDYLLLKAFDRVMWGKYYAARKESTKLSSVDPDENNEKRAQLENEFETYKPSGAMCPYGDPSDTGSIIMS